MSTILGKAHHLLLAAGLAACSTDTGPLTDQALGVSPPSDPAALDRAFKRLIEQHQVVTAGVGVIDDGQLVWTGYYGKQSPGVPASQHTLFDVASITKTLAAETVLRLVETGEMSLDESMATHWVDPDLKDDPRHEALTPRMVLNHTTGFMNWRFFSSDNTLRLINDPGTTYGYSGEGFDYLMRFVEGKLGRDFESLMQATVFDPVGMQKVSFSVREANFPSKARPEDQDGRFYGYYCRPSGWCRNEGDYSAADDLIVSVEDYAAFLISVMNADGYGGSMAAERNRVATDQSNVPESLPIPCKRVDTDQCPIRQGYGLGWEVVDYGEEKIILHGGSDWSEVALAYFYQQSRDGVIIFLNAPNIRALGAMPAAIELVDPDSPLSEHYRAWFENEKQ